MLFLGIALDGTKLAATRTGGMYYSFKIYEYFSRLPQYHVDHDGVSSLPAHVLGRIVKLHLFSLYLLIMRGRRRYEYIFLSGAWTCLMYLLFSKLRGSKIVILWFHRMSMQSGVGPMDRFIWRLREWFQLKIADHAVVISRSTLESIREMGFIGNNYILAVPGMDKELWIDRTAGYDPFRSGFKVVCTASVIPHKGIMDLLIAFADFVDTIENSEDRRRVTLDIIGNDQIDSALTSELRGIIRDRRLEDNVFLRGRRSLQELMDFYRDASVFVHPSHYEGWGIVVQEAASFGLPIIVSDGGSLPEVVNDGQYGLVYPVGDRAALTEQLKLVYRDVDCRTELSVKAAELYCTAITWEESGRLIFEYLNSMENIPNFKIDERGYEKHV